MSLIDLVKYEGPKSKSTAQPARESHVSFSVKGLGHVKMETPPQSPRSTKRILPLPPKAMRYTQNKARRSMPFDATKGLDSLMNGISMMKERNASYKMGSVVDESSYERRKHCYSSHSFENYSDNLYPEDEDMFCKPQAQEGWHSKFGRTDDNLLDVNSDRPWKFESFNSDDHFPTPGEFDTFDYSFKEQRTSTRPSTRFGSSGNPSGHDIFSDQSLLDDDDDMLRFDWERQPRFKKIPNSMSNFGPSAWSSEMVDDSEKRKSPLSEESCSSAAAMKDRTSKPTLSTKREENNMNEKDDFHTRLDKLDIPNMDAHLDRISLFKDQEEYCKRATDEFEADYWPDKAMEEQRTREPSCHLSLQEKFAHWGSSTSHLKGSSGPNNPSSCTVMGKDKPFDSIPNMGGYQTVGSTERRPASKVHPVLHRSDSAVLYDDIHLQNPVSDIFGDKIDFPDPFSSTGLQGDIDVCTFLGQKVDKKKEEIFDSFKNPNADIYHPGSSVGQTVFGQRSTCSQQSGKDSRRQGFDPGIDFQESGQGFDPVSSVRQTVFGQRSACSQQSGKDSQRQGFDPGIDFQESRKISFWEDGHVSNDTFQGDVELSGLLSRKSGKKNKDGIEKFEMRESKMSRQISQCSADYRTEMSEAETCSDGSEVTNSPGVQKEASSEAAQLPANLNLQETAREMFQIHAQVDCVRKETMEIPGVGFKAPLHLGKKIHDVGDHTKSIPKFQSPFMADKVGIEKKIITGTSPHNSGIQYEVMLECHVLQRLCVQKISVDTPTRDKLAKVTGFRTTENGSVLPRSV